jgi:hypothetical protein
LIPKSLQFAPDWKFYFDVRDAGGEGEIVKSSERGGNGDWRMRGGLFHLTSFSYSSPDSMSGINQIVSLLKEWSLCETLERTGWSQFIIFV